MRTRYDALSILIGILVVALSGPPFALAQDQASEANRFFPRQGFMLTGYGAAGYHAVLAGDNLPNSFSAVFAPIMLFQVSDRFLFEGELEFNIEDGVTETELEYAQVDMALSNNLTLVAGKFLLPFNAFSERMHPTWINRFVSAPALYGGHGSPTPADPLLPIVSDIGVQVRGAFAVGRFSTITAEAFITQGPMMAEEAHGADGAAEEDGHGDVAFGGDFTDNNEDKMIGGRVGFGIAPYFEFNVSGMTGAYDPAGELRFSALGAHLEGRYKSFTMHGELIQTWQDVAEEEEHAGTTPAKNGTASSASLDEVAAETIARNGYWVQVGYRWNKWQPVLRFTQVFEAEHDGEIVSDGGRQLALGLDYWFEPALALKVEYLFNDEEQELDNNRIALQLAFGF